jgi:type I restriction enzyme, S subunit
MSIHQYDYYGASGVIDKVEGFLFDDKLLLIAEDGANLVLRNLPLAIIAEGKFWVNNHAHILKPRRGDICFLAAALEGLNFLPWISGAAQPKLTQDRLMGISIAVPTAEQQQKIIECCDAATIELTRAISAARREVALLQEFRTRLIADVVTGKLDVRAAATGLPEITELELVDEPPDGEDLKRGN